MENLLKDMGKRIFDRRKQLNMTQETLAELAHVTPQTISTAELGQKAMRPETILKVCDALHISTEYLLRGVITVLAPGDHDHILSGVFNQFLSANPRASRINKKSANNPALICLLPLVLRGKS